MFQNSEIKDFQLRTNRNKDMNSAKRKIDFLYQEIENLNNEANILINKNHSNSKNKKSKNHQSYSNIKKKGVSNEKIINKNNLNLYRNYNNINNIGNNINYNSSINNTQYSNYQNAYKKRKSLPKNNFKEIIGIDDYIKNEKEENIFAKLKDGNEIENEKYKKYQNKIIYLANNQNIHNYSNNQVENDKLSYINKILSENNKLKKEIKELKEQIAKIMEENTYYTNEAESWHYDYNRIFKENINLGKELSKYKKKIREYEKQNFEKRNLEIQNIILEKKKKPGKYEYNKRKR